MPPVGLLGVTFFKKCVKSRQIPMSKLMPFYYCFVLPLSLGNKRKDADTAHFLKNVTLSCPTGGMLPRAACHWLTKSESASYWLTQSATYSILPPAQASCCSTLDMLSSYIVRGTVRHKFALTFCTEI